MAQYEDLEVDQGATAKWRVKMLDTDGSARDLTGYSASGSLNRSYNADSDELVNFNVQFLTPRTDGILEFYLTAEQTEGLSRRRYVYDFVVSFDEDSATTVERVLEGNISVSRKVTNT